MRPFEIRGFPGDWGTRTTFLAEIHGGTRLAVSSSMSRHPPSRYWKRLIGFPAGAAVIFVVLLWSHSYLLAIAALIATTIAYMVYTTGESSDLPGTAGKHDKNIPT